MMNNHKQRHLEKKSQLLLSDDMLRGKRIKLIVKISNVTQRFYLRGRLISILLCHWL